MRNILITGASSGIGAALAKEAARLGAERLFISGRNAERLSDAAAKCACAVHQRTIDVTNRAAMREWLEECDSIAPLDVVVANAGRATGEETETNARDTFAVNLDGALNTVFPAIDAMRRRRRGKIAIVSSMTAYHGMPQCPSYSASKAALKAWGAGLRGMLAREGISVSVICPGFVRSRITDRNTCPMPFFMEADKAARIIWRGIARNAPLVAFPWQMRLASWFMASLPERLSSAIFARLPQKENPHA